MKLGSWALGVALLVTGCGQASPVGPRPAAKARAAATAPPAADIIVTPVDGVDRGHSTVALAVGFAGTGYHVQATGADVARVVVVLKTRSFLLLKTVATAEILRERVVNGKATVSFTQLKAGTYTVEFTAYDVNGAVIGTGSSTVDVFDGKTSHLASSLKLIPGAPANSGLGLDLTIVDGDLPVGQPTPQPTPTPAPVGTPTPSPVLPGNGTRTNVPAGASLQAAIDAAQPGDTLVLAAGARYQGPVTLRKKSGDAPITLTTSGLASLPAEGQRVSPGNAGAMAMIMAGGRGEGALVTEPGAHHYRVVGLEFAQPDPASTVYDLIRLGAGDDSQTLLSQVPHHLVFERCYVHAHADGELKRGFALNSADTRIADCYVSGFKGKGYDTQAIAGWNGPGRYTIVNNFLQGAGENLLFGGSDPAIANLVPSDIEIRGNHFDKPLSWNGAYSVKNLFELKNARRVIIDGNRFENNWADGQAGRAILFTVRNQDGRAPWSQVAQITFTHNLVRHSGAALNILGTDDLHQSLTTTDIHIADNLFLDIDGQYGGNGMFLVIGAGTKNVTIDHNTVLHTGNITSAYGAPTTGFVFTNNLMAHNAYGIHGESQSPGNGAIGAFFPEAVIRGNVIVGANASVYPTGNFYPAGNGAAALLDAGAGYRLAAGSPYRGAGTDGRDVGCDAAALAGVGGN